MEAWSRIVVMAAMRSGLFLDMSFKIELNYLLILVAQIPDPNMADKQIRKFNEIDSK